MESKQFLLQVVKHSSSYGSRVIAVCCYFTYEYKKDMHCLTTHFPVLLTCTSQHESDYFGNFIKHADAKPLSNLTESYFWQWCPVMFCFYFLFWNSKLTKSCTSSTKYSHIHLLLRLSTVNILSHLSHCFIVFSAYLLIYSHFLNHLRVWYRYATCPLTPKYFRVCFLKNRLSHVTGNQEINIGITQLSNL